MSLGGPKWDEPVRSPVEHLPQRRDIELTFAHQQGGDVLYLSDRIAWTDGNLQVEPVRTDHGEERRRRAVNVTYCVQNGFKELTQVPRCQQPLFQQVQPSNFDTVFPIEQPALDRGSDQGD